MVKGKHFMYLTSIICCSLILTLAAISAADNDAKEYRNPFVPGGALVTDLPNDQAWELRKQAIGTSGNEYNLGKWTNEGPNGIGRIWDLVIDPRDDKVLYVGAGTGSGLWKTTDGGSTFKCLSNDWKSQSIGDIELDPQNPDIVWVGGGECIVGGGSIAYPGVGIYKSIDGGETWEHKGLDSSYFISRVEVHPTNSNIVFVGVLGNLFSGNPQRGLYKTEDGGNTWKNLLEGYVNDTTGCVDFLIYTPNPKRIIAATWTAIRQPYYRRYASSHDKVYKSEDGGATWSVMSGFPSSMGRINMDMCETKPDIMYVNVLKSNSEQGYMYKSSNGGQSFSRTGSQPNGNFAYYGFAFNRVLVNPKNPDECILNGITIDRTTNGGGNWSASKWPSSNHVDYHATAWGYNNNKIVYCGDDGGLRKCSNGIGSSLTTLGKKSLANGGLSLAQFYGGDVAKGDQRYRIAGLQDNGTRATTSAAHTNWSQRFGGDGFHCKINPRNTNIGIGSLQHGVFYMTTNKTSWRGVSIGGRKQWDCGCCFDPITGRAYAGSQYVWCAPYNNTRFSQISSQDLTNGNHTMSGSSYKMGSITALAAYDGVCYAGTDDGNVWYSKNATGAGASWKKIRNGKLSGNTERTKYDGWITDLYIDESDETGATCYVAVWYHRWGQNYYKPSIYKLTNWGDGGVGSADWKDISGDLPGFITTHKVVKDNNSGATKGFLYCATDYGMFYSMNEGVNWKWMGDATMPIMTIKDISMRAEGYVFAFSYGRGLYKMDLSNVKANPNIKDLSSKGNQIINNYPNPIISKTNIRFRVNDNQKVSLGIYNLSGRLVKKVFNKNVIANKLNTITWDVTNTNGKKVAAGNYICRLIGEKVTLARLITVKK